MYGLLVHKEVTFDKVRIWFDEQKSQFFVVGSRLTQYVDTTSRNNWKRCNHSFRQPTTFGRTYAYVTTRIEATPVCYVIGLFKTGKTMKVIVELRQT